MLVDIVLDWPRLDALANERGFIAEFVPHMSEGKEYSLLQTRYNPTHPFMIEHNITESHTIPHYIRQTVGVYWSHDMEHVLDEMSTTPCIDPYLTFNLGTGEHMTHEEMTRQFNLGWEKLDEELPDDNQWHQYQTSAYGVADNVPQILQYFHAVIGNPNNKVIISISEVHRENQSSSGGWRWHKNGKYIGTQKPQCEYLYDDKHIDKIMQFHVYCVQ